ncbi:MAG TPA: DUF4349 domain-containing protein [Gemmatimonadales bacterium]|nr:DUF4349 domain-containing protein [Gemmatimonadales bacterium]
MRRSIVTLISLVVFGACGDRARTTNRSEVAQGLVLPSTAPAAERDMYEAAAPEAADRTQPDARPAPQQRMIARTAQIRAVVSDPVATVQALTTLVEAKGGFISDSRQWRSGEQMLASLTIRVPVRDLPATLDSIRHRAIRVENESTSGEDVTEQYADLRAQLTNLRATETELRALLVTVRQRTQRAADILEVFNQLAAIRQQIDRTQSRITTLEQLTDLATITVELVPDALAQPLTAGRWRPLAVVRAAFRTLLSTLRWLLDAAIWLLIYLVPVVLVLAVPALGVFIGIRAVRRRMSLRKRAVPDAG